MSATNPSGTTERIQALRLTTEEFDERWAMADVADAQYEKVVKGLIEWMPEWFEEKSNLEDWPHSRTVDNIGLELVEELNQALAASEELDEVH